MRSGSRKVLAVTVVAMALCADRTLAAASASHRSQGQETLTSQVVRKLQNSFRRIVPSAVDPLCMREVRFVAPRTVAFVATESIAVSAPLMPNQFCLPPPLL